MRAEPDAVNGLTYAGFDIVSVANNHIGDYDFEGMTDSFERLEDAGIDHAGGGLDFDKAHTPVIKNINGTIIAVLADTNVPMYMDATGPYAPTPKWIAREGRPGIARAHNTRFEMYGDLAQMSENIIQAKAILIKPGICPALSVSPFVQCIIYRVVFIVRERTGVQHLPDVVCKGKKIKWLFYKRLGACLDTCLFGYNITMAGINNNRYVWPHSHHLLCQFVASYVRHVHICNNQIKIKRI
ncbi:MAG: CapA family protein [Proteobacteria bacterium]|nr:CapA family protein [Pseudomonadota bacterium]